MHVDQRIRMMKRAETEV